MGLFLHILKTFASFLKYSQNHSLAEVLQAKLELNRRYFIDFIWVFNKDLLRFQANLWQ